MVAFGPFASDDVVSKPVDVVAPGALQRVQGRFDVVLYFGLARMHTELESDISSLVMLAEELEGEDV